MSDEQSFNPRPAQPRQPPPKILRNHELDGRVVRVTYALPGLRRATVHVPRERWQAGGHTPVGTALAGMLAELDLQRERHSGRVSG